MCPTRAWRRERAGQAVSIPAVHSRLRNQARVHHMHFRGIRFIFGPAAYLCVATLTIPATAQTFTTIINSPPNSVPTEIESNTQINLFGGLMLNTNLGASDGSSTNIELNIFDGVTRDFFSANAGSTVNLLPDGTIASSFSANSGSTVNISGGTVGFRFAARLGSTVNISGGFIRDHFGAGPGSIVTVSGGTISSGSNVSGIFNLSNGAVGDEFQALSGSQVSISGGSIGRLSRARDGSEINITGGSIGGSFSAFPGSLVTLSSGSIGSFSAATGAILNVSGGIIEDHFSLNSGSTMNLTGGEVGPFLNVESGSTINMYGGSIPGASVLAGSSINIFGSSFVVDGVNITQDLVLNQAWILDNPSVSIQAVLQDGSLLNTHPFISFQRFAIDPGATVTITLVPEPTTIGLLGIGSLGLLRRRAS